MGAWEEVAIGGDHYRLYIDVIDTTGRHVWQLSLNAWSDTRHWEVLDAHGNMLAMGDAENIYASHMVPARVEAISAATQIVRSMLAQLSVRGLYNKD